MVLAFHKPESITNDLLSADPVALGDAGVRAMVKGGCG